METVVRHPVCLTKQRIVIHIVTAGTNAQWHNFKIITEFFTVGGKRYTIQRITQSADSASLCPGILHLICTDLIAQELQVASHGLRFIFGMCHLGTVHCETDVPASVKSQIAAQNRETIVVISLGIHILKHPGLGMECRVMVDASALWKCHRNNHLFQQQTQRTGRTWHFDLSSFTEDQQFF